MAVFSTIVLSISCSSESVRVTSVCYRTISEKSRSSCVGCGCNTTGTRRLSSWPEGTLLPCNDTGFCDCQLGFEGKQCEIVKPGFYVAQRNELAGVSARPCTCSLIGSVSQECDKVIGQCKCKDGVTGRDCSECKVDYYRFSPTGCTRKLQK